MSNTKADLSNSGWIYRFKRCSIFVFLDRKDNLIKSFDTYNQAVTYANMNIRLIDQNTINKQ